MAEQKTERKSWQVKIKKLSPLKKPDDLTLEAWQTALRKQMARETSLRFKNTGTHPVFSSFEVTNPKTQRTYRVVIRGSAPGINYCSCPDFSVNTLGTCKHVEFMLQRLGRTREIREMLRAGFVSGHSSVTLRYGAERHVAFSFGRNADAEMKKLVSGYFDANHFLTPQGFSRFDRFMKETADLRKDIRFHEDAVTYIACHRDQEKRKNLVDQTFPRGIYGSEWKRLIHADLFPYQRQGVLFAAKAGRSLIADDMGLGKTVQAIAASEVMARAFGVEKVLIVCPSSLKFQWKQEIEKFTNRPAEVIQGPLSVRRDAYGNPGFFKIVNYDVIHRDLAAIEKWAPDLVILDEAQRIKNWKTRLAKSVKRLPSTYAIVLTGTPLENRLEELHSLIEFIDQHHLGPLFRFLDRHQVTDESGKVTGYKDLHALGKTLENILIRRTKKEVLSQLPGRADKHYFIPMMPEQRAIHEENREMAARIVLKWRRYRFLSDEDQRRLMIALQNMRMVCDNTYLIDKKTIKGKKIDELEMLLREIFENPKNKVVIFSQWVGMGELVEAMLGVNNWKYVFLNGNVPSPKRGDLIKTFKEDPKCRVFLSTDAGGTGLNLQHASTIINLDLPWNPAVMEQRISRVHRLGQERMVRVINLVAEATIESGMLEVHRFKKSMFSGVLEGGSDTVFMEGGRLNRFMKTVEAAADSMPKRSEENEDFKEAEQDQKTAQEEVEENDPETSVEKTSGTPSAPAALPVEAMKSLLNVGASFLAGLSRSLDTGFQEASTGAGRKSEFFQIKEDLQTGQKFIQIPWPSAGAMENFKKLAESFSSRISPEVK